MVKLLIIGAVGVLMAGIVYVILIFHPFQWGLVKSRNFSWSKFEAVQNGDSIESVIQRLGEPVWPPEDWEVLSADPNDPCVVGRCQRFSFAGAAWGTSFYEAFVIVDARGKVIHAIAHQE